MIHKKYPVKAKCLLLNFANLQLLQKEFGKDFSELATFNGTYKKHSGLFDFVTDKIKHLSFPKLACYQVAYEFDKRRNPKYAYEQFHTENACLIELPKHFDTKNDFADAVERRANFFSTMKEFMGKKYDEKKLEENVEFGTTDFGYINELLGFLHTKFSEYYSLEDKLPIFLDLKDECYWLKNSESVIDYPFPQAYFLSDIEKHLQDDYGLDTSELYQWVINGMYIEGRYWERYYNWKPETENFRKQKASTNVQTMIGLILQDFKLELDSFHKVNGLPLYVDYYKEIKL